MPILRTSPQESRGSWPTQIFVRNWAAKRKNERRKCSVGKKRRENMKLCSLNSWPKTAIAHSATEPTGSPLFLASPLFLGVCQVRGDRRIDWNAVRVIVKPACQFAVADSAMRLDPLSFATDRFAFRPEYTKPREQTPIEEHAISKNLQIARGNRNEQAQIQS